MTADREAEERLQRRAAEAARQLLDTPALRRLIEAARRITDGTDSEPDS